MNSPERRADARRSVSYRSMSEIPRRSGIARTIAIATFAATVVLLAGCAQDGEESTGSSELPAATVIDADPTALLGPAAFEEVIATGDAIVVNVHVPYEGHIEGTNAFIPFDEVGSSALPADLNQPIALYCRSGNMSATATRTLVEMGYTDVVDLAVGMNAWVEAGRPLKESLES